MNQYKQTITVTLQVVDNNFQLNNFEFSCDVDKKWDYDTIMFGPDGLNIVVNVVIMMIDYYILIVVNIDLYYTIVIGGWSDSITI